MKRIIYFATLVLIMTLVCCTTTDDALENGMDPASNRTLTVVAGLPSTGEPGAQSRSITQDANSLDILLRWEVGNTGIKLVFKQGDKLVQATEEASIKSVEQEGRVGSFDVEIPQVIDISQPFDLYGTTSRLIEVGNGKILTGINEYWFTLPSYAQNNLLEVPVYFEAKNVTAGTVPEINFRHLGSLGVITIKSTATEMLENRGCSIVKADPEGDDFFYDGFAPFQNLLDLEETVVYLENKVLQRPMLSLEPGETKTFVHWLCPNGNPVPETKISLGDVISQNSLPIRDALKIGNAYHVYAIWNGQNLLITDDSFSFPVGELPTITMTTSKAIGESITLRVDAAKEDWPNVWIDLNNNGLKESGEEVVTFSSEVADTYTLGSQTVTIHGKVTFLYCSVNQLISLDVSNNTELTSLSCHNNHLTSLDVSNSTELGELWCNNNQLVSLDVPNSTKLTRLWCYDNQLTSLDVSNNTELTWLSCNNNQLTSLDVSNNTKLTYLRCSINQLTSLDVSNNTELTMLACDNNQFNSLDVSNATKLLGLYCHGNHLTSLDVSNSTELGQLWCNNNQLTSLDFSKNTELSSLWCCGNQITGDKMTVLVNSLPDRTGKVVGEFRVIYPWASTEGNVITAAQGTIATGKNWPLLDGNGNPYTPPSGTSGGPGSRPDMPGQKW